MEHMALEPAMRGGVIDCSLPAVRSAASSLCNPTVMTKIDVVIIGAGHNGLTCAAYLAKAGLPTSGAVCSSAAAIRSEKSSYANGGTCRPMPWCRTPPVIRSSSWRLDLQDRDAPVAGRPDDLGDPVVGVDARASRARSRHRVRNASSTGLRPSSSSGPSLVWMDRRPGATGAARDPAAGGRARTPRAAAAHDPRWCPSCRARRPWARGPRLPRRGAPCPACGPSSRASSWVPE